MIVYKTFPLGGDADRSEADEGYIGQKPHI